MNKIRLLSVLSLLVPSATALASVVLTGRAARSVHLLYAPLAEKPVEVRGTVTVRESAPGSYFMGIGFATGYCGLQEAPDGSHLFIFSVWDPGNPMDLRAREDLVPEDRRAKNLYNNPVVTVRRFGGEGTGLQALAGFNWEIGRPVELHITAEPDGEDRTAFTCWIRKSDKGEPEDWEKVATFSTGS